MLGDRLAHDRTLAERLHELLSTVTAIHASASILADAADLDPNWRNRFQRNIIEDSARLARGAQALVDRLEGPGDAAATTLSPQDAVEALCDRHAHHFPALETHGAAAIDAIVAADEALASPGARALAGTHLLARAGEAATLPLPRLAAALARHGPDPCAIAEDTETDIATVLRRLAALPERMLPQPVGLAVCDGSGTLIRRRNVAGVCAAAPGRAVRALAAFHGNVAADAPDPARSSAADRAVPGRGADLVRRDATGRGKGPAGICISSRRC